MKRKNTRQILFHDKSNMKSNIKVDTFSVDVVKKCENNKSKLFIDDKNTIYEEESSNHKNKIQIRCGRFSFLSVFTILNRYHGDEYMYFGIVNTEYSRYPYDIVLNGILNYIEKALDLTRFNYMNQEHLITYDMLIELITELRELIYKTTGINKKFVMAIEFVSKYDFRKDFMEKIVRLNSENFILLPFTRYEVEEISFDFDSVKYISV